ncbi:MAG TPA: UDP-glucose 4-epimerase GalE [Anaerolineales bacterium]|nr:UDP-glucose 4-epimerase GalE [Anaerolineales bacterium]
MNLLVTGGAGYIGSATSAALLAAGHQVTVYDNLSKGFRNALPVGARFVHGDIGDAQALTKVFAETAFDGVLHFASLIEAGESMRDPGTYFRANVAHSNVVLNAVAQAGVPNFVLSSTAAVYAGSDQPLREDSLIQPANVYGHTKLMIEQMLAWYRQIYGLNYAVLRYFNACGAVPERGEAHQPETHLIPNVFKVALGQRDSFQLFGTDYPTPDGTCIRDYIHIADLASAHTLAVMALPEKGCMTYNLGTGHGYSIREIVSAAREITGHPIPLIEQARRPGDAPRLVADPSKIAQELGWRAKYSSLENILKTAWNWHQNHPYGYVNG